MTTLHCSVLCLELLLSCISLRWHYEPSCLLSWCHSWCKHLVLAYYILHARLLPHYMLDMLVYLAMVHLAMPLSPPLHNPVQSTPSTPAQPSSQSTHLPSQHSSQLSHGLVLLQDCLVSGTDPALATTTLATTTLARVTNILPGMVRSPH